MDEMIQISQLAEENSFQTVWIADHAPATRWRDPFIALAAIGQKTESIRLGCGVANPYSRHTGLTGVTAATIAELCENRMILGMGAGGTLPLRPLGIKMWNKPLTAVRESIEVLRKLFAGDEVNYEGKIVSLKGIKLFDEVNVPIYIGTRGPKLTKMAGEIADGVIFNPPLEALSIYIEKINEGLNTSKRKKIEVVEFLPVYISESHNLDPVRPIVALLLPTTPEFALEIIDAKEIGKKISEVMMQDRSKGPALVPDNLVTSFAIAGNTSQCIDQIERLIDQVDELVCLAFGSTESVIETIKVMGKDVIPSF
jgi:5,10-methylenetetrahydromethanopterin reductase